MRSVLRFLVFVVVLTASVALLYFWKSAKNPDSTTAERPNASRVISKLPALEEIDREFTTLIGEVLPSVVSINAIPADTANPRMQLLRRLLGGETAGAPLQMGSGVVVSNEGHIVTNYHVVSGAASVEVSLNDGRVFPAKFVGADRPSDIAILKIEADGLSPIGWGNSDNVRVGQMVFAVGNPLGLEETVTQGIISAKGRRAASEAANEFFQTDAAVNRGNSGGPLIDLRGQLIGINNMIAAAQAQGIAFAIPSNTVRRVFESIRDHGRFIRPWFGAVMRSLTPQLVRQLNLPDGTGALVIITYAGSPAEKAGLLAGDVVTEFNGRAVQDHVDLRNRMTDMVIGEKVPLKVRRGSKILDLQVTIAPEPQG